MRVRTGRQSISSTYYVYSFPNKCFRDVFLAHSWFSQSAAWLRHQDLKFISSTLGPSVAFPTCPRAAVLPLQITQHSHVLWGQFLGSDQGILLLPMSYSDKGSSQTHQCQGVDHHKFALKFNLTSPQREIPTLFVLLTVPQDPALHLLLHSWTGIHLPSLLSDPTGNLHNSKIVETGQYKNLTHMLVLGNHLALPPTD